MAEQRGKQQRVSEGRGDTGDALQARAVSGGGNSCSAHSGDGYSAMSTPAEGPSIVQGLLVFMMPTGLATTITRPHPDSLGTSQLSCVKLEY